MTYLERHLKRLVVDILEIDREKDYSPKVVIGFTKDNWDELSEYIDLPLDEGRLTVIAVNVDKGAGKMFLSVFCFGQKVFSREVGIKYNKEIR